MRASANNTSVRTSPSDKFVRLTRDPSLPTPARFERLPKAPGSFELVHGRLVEVK